jgi:hypothetical protein
MWTTALEETYQPVTNGAGMAVRDRSQFAREIRACPLEVDDREEMTTRLAAATFVASGPVGRPIHELSLHEALLDAAELLLPAPRYERVAIPELTIRGCRPDVVVADIELERFEARRAAGLLPLTSSADIAVRSVFRRASRQLSQDEITSSTARYVSPDAARASITRCLRLGAIVAGRKGFSADSAFTAATRATHGVEAKVGSWRGAAQQAQRWRLYFDRAWLSFPDTYVPIVPLDLPGIRMFGVVTVTANRSVEVISAPPTRRADPFNATLLEEYLYARWLEEMAISSGALAVQARFAASA